MMPWYVDQEVDKVERKNKSPGKLKNPLKRRKVQKTGKYVTNDDDKTKDDKMMEKKEDECQMMDVCRREHDKEGVQVVDEGEGLRADDLQEGVIVVDHEGAGSEKDEHHVK